VDKLEGDRRGRQLQPDVFGSPRPRASCAPTASSVPYTTETWWLRERLLAGGLPGADAVGAAHRIRPRVNNLFGLTALRAHFRRAADHRCRNRRALARARRPGASVFDAALINTAVAQAGIRCRWRQHFPGVEAGRSARLADRSSA